MPEPLARLLERIHEVCPVPATAQRVVELTSHDQSDLRAIAEAVASDPALGAEVLRIANSPAYRRGAPVTEIERAVAMLGMAELHDMASAMAMLAAFGSKDELGLRLHDRAVLAATLARAVARQVEGPRPGTAFVCGLLAEIGAMACLTVDAASYRAILARTGVDLETREAEETVRYGATAREIGGHLLARNGLPEEIATTVGATAETDDRTPLVRITQLVWHLSPALIQAGFDDAPTEVDVALDTALARSGLGVSRAVLEHAAYASAGLTLSALSTVR